MLPNLNNQNIGSHGWVNVSHNPGPLLIASANSLLASKIYLESHPNHVPKLDAKPEKIPPDIASPYCIFLFKIWHHNENGKGRDDDQKIEMNK